MVLVDTPIWSLALRRKVRELAPEQGALVAAWAKLVRERRVVIIGPIRQEVLSGIRDSVVFERLRGSLHAFEEETLFAEDYEEAARCFNCCRSAGIAGSNVDFLLCAVALRRHLEIFTTDADFLRFAKHLPFRLYKHQMTGQ